jgi:hypothetical protein
MTYYMAVITDEDKVVSVVAFTDITGAVTILSEKYLQNPEKLYMNNADCRIDISGRITRLSINPGFFAAHKLREEYEFVKAIQIATSEEVATTVHRLPTIGDETNYIQGEGPWVVLPASTSTPQ